MLLEILGNSPSWLINVNLQHRKSEETISAPKSEETSDKTSWIQDVIRRKQNTNKIVQAGMSTDIHIFNINFNSLNMSYLYHHVLRD